MKRQSIILSFIPWIVFSTSTGYADFLDSSLIALTLSIVIAGDSLLRGVVLEIGGVLFFTAMAILGFFLHHDDVFTQYPNLWSNLAMMIIMLSSVLINKPFTEQYTDQGTHQLHMNLSAIWGFLLLFASICSIPHVYFGVSNNTTNILGTIIAIVLGIQANRLYPKWFYRRQLIRS